MYGCYTVSSTQFGVVRLSAVTVVAIIVIIVIIIHYSCSYCFHFFALLLVLLILWWAHAHHPLLPAHTGCLKVVLPVCVHYSQCLSWHRSLPL